MRDILVLGWGFLSIPIAFYRPFYGMVVFSILAYNRTQDLTWGIASRYRLSFYIAIATLVGFLLKPAGGKYLIIEKRTLLLLLLLVLIYGSVVYAEYPHLSYRKFYEFLKVMIIALVTPPLLINPKRVRILFWTIALSLGFYGIKNALLFQQIRNGPGGMLLDNNDFSSALVMVIPFLYYLSVSEEKPLYKRGFLIAVPLTMITIALTESRGGFLALATVFAVLVLKSKRRIIAICLAPFLVLVFFMVVPGRYLDRLSTIGNYEEDASAMGRLRAWGVALRMSEAYPWLGGGYRNFQSLYPDFSIPRGEKGRVAHNSYLQLMAESGRPALIVFLSLVLLTIWNSRQVERLARGKADKPWYFYYASAIEVSLYGYMVGAFFLNRAHFDLLYHLVAISIAINVLARREVREEAIARSRQATPLSAETQERALVYGAGP